MRTSSRGKACETIVRSNPQSVLVILGWRSPIRETVRQAAWKPASQPPLPAFAGYVSEQALGAINVNRPADVFRRSLDGSPYDR